MRINAEILDLRAFLAVLELRNFHRAADLLNMSQPALSRRVKALEAAFGAPLLERSTRRVTPTRLGLEIEPMVRRVIQEMEDCVFTAGGASGRRQGQLTVAAAPTVAAGFVPTVVERFLTHYPDIHVRILDLTAKESLQCVLTGEADIGLNFYGASHQELKFTSIINDEFVLICRKDHEFASLQKISWRDLSECRLIISRKSENRSIIDQALARSNLELNWSIEVGHLATSFRLVETGIGMSIVPRLAAPEAGHALLTSVALGSPEVRRTIGVIERREGRLPLVAEKFREVVVAEAKKIEARRSSADEERVSRSSKARARS